MQIRPVFLSGILIFSALYSTAQVTSTFDTDADGWTTANAEIPSPTPTYSASGGNPGGMIQATDLPVGASVPISYFVAPAKFLGNKSFSYGQNLRFNIQQSVGRAYVLSADVIISNGSTTLYYMSTDPTYPAVAPLWSSYTILLSETSSRWRTSNSATGTVATKAQMKSVLANLTSLQIRGRYGSSPVAEGRIDNVILESLSVTSAPVINTFSPEAGVSLETLVTIDGSGFGATAATNAVYFGSTQATIVNASPTQLSVTAPSGKFGPVTVINLTNGLQAQSKKPFNFIFPDGGRIIPASFDPKIDITLDATAGNDVRGLAIADMDGDGWNDIIAAENAINSVSILRNLKTGGDIKTTSFAAKFSLAGGGNGGGLRTLDLDGDGKLDVICGYTDGSTTYFATFRNTSTPGNLSFQAVELWPGLVYSGPLSNAADVDGDGRIDLIGQHGNGSVSVDFWIAQNISTPGNIEFAASVSYFGGSTLDAGDGVAVGDLDNDGKPEMVVIHSFGNQFQIIKNTSAPGTISFGTPFVIAESINGDIEIADFNLDGKNDLMWASLFDGDDIHIRLNNNAGGTLAAADFSTEIILRSDLSYSSGGVSIADINGDGKPDIIASDDADMGIFENVYSGGAFNAASFIEAYQWQGGGTSTYPTAVSVADLNGDNKPDLLFGTTNTTPPRISIFENRNVHTPVISLTTVSPLKGPVGATVTITGDHFSTTPGENVVHFGAVRATVLTASRNTLTVAVPAGASYAPVSVTRNELTARYHLPFNVVFSPGTTLDATSFGPPVNFTLTGADYDLDVADLNGDNKPDVIAEALGAFGTPQTYSFRNVHTSGAITTSSLVVDDTTFTSARNPKLIDLNGDNKPDLASADGLSRNVSSGLEINFDPLVAVGNTSNIGFADFNLDGKPDFTGVSGSTLQVFENWTRPGLFVTGTFPSLSASFNLTKPGANGGSAVADFDNDGFADIASTNSGSDNITVWRNSGGYRISTAMFTSTGNIPTLDNPGRIYDADFDADGKVDFVIYHGTGTLAAQKTISVFHNQSTAGTISFVRQDFVLPGTAPANEVATTLGVGDLDGDGRPEVIMVSEAANSFRIWKNNTTPGVINSSSFIPSSQITLTSPRSVAVGDINQDGKADLIFTRVNLLTVMENLLTASSISFVTQPSPTAICEGTSVNITLTAAGDTNLQYQWQVYDVPTSSFVNLANGASYSGVNANTLTILNPNPTMNGAVYRSLVRGDFTNYTPSASATLTVNAAPAAPATTGASACAGSSALLNASGGSNGQYRWYNAVSGGVAMPGEVNSTYATPALTTTTAYFVAINNGTCESTRTQTDATVIPLPPAPSSTGASRCSPGTLTLSASGSTNGNYRWYDVATGGSAIPGEVNASFTTPSLTATTNYFVAVTNSTCESARTSVTATINTPPAKPVITSNITPGAGNTINICNETVTLTAPAGFSAYLWSGGQQTQQVTTTTAGTYSVQVTDTNGCTSISSDVITISVVASLCNNPPVIEDQTIATQIEGKVTTSLASLISDPDNNLDLSTLRIVTQPSSGASATIDSNSNLVINYSGISFSGADKLTVEVCDQSGSCTQKEITIEVVGDIEVFNAVSPNGDNLNDFLRLQYIEILPDTRKNHVSIFNRWGDKVFEIDDYNNSSRVFTGLNSNGKELPSGTYFYKIDFSGSRKSQTGYLTLKR